MARKARRCSILFGVVLLAFFVAHPGFAQPTEDLKGIRKEIEALKEGQAAIRKELQEIKTLLRARPAPASPAEPQNIVLSVDGSPFKGEKHAKVTLIDFSDYQ